MHIKTIKHDKNDVLNVKNRITVIVRVLTKKFIFVNQISFFLVEIYPQSFASQQSDLNFDNRNTILIIVFM